MDVKVLLVSLVFYMLTENEIRTEAAPVLANADTNQLNQLQTKLSSLQKMIENLNRRNPPAEVPVTPSPPPPTLESTEDQSKDNSEQPQQQSDNYEDMYMSVLHSLKPEEIAALRRVRDKLNAIKMALELQQYRENENSNSQTQHSHEQNVDLEPKRRLPERLPQQPESDQELGTENDPHQKLLALAEIARRNGMTLKDLVLSLQRQREQLQDERDVAQALTEHELLELVNKQSHPR